MQKINLDKVIFLYNNYHIQDLNSNYDVASEILDSKYIQTLRHSSYAISTPEIDVINNVDNDKYVLDSVYEKNFELVAIEIINRNIEERFAFVSIDVDFGESIYQGIKYFYPRLNEGGYIFVHDYNSRLTGVREAIGRYEVENAIHICKIPLCDMNGTLIIIK